MLPTISSREINSFPSKWPHHFGACWVLDLNGAGAGLLQDANRVGNVDGVAETGVNVDDQRQVDHTTDSHHMLGDLAQVHESEVWQAKPRCMLVNPAPVRYTVKPRSAMIRAASAFGAWQNNALLIAKLCTKRLDMRFRHRSLLHS
jgi:hypothetical protein